MSKKELEINYAGVLSEKVSIKHGLRKEDIMECQDKISEILAEISIERKDLKSPTRCLDLHYQDIGPYLKISKQLSKTHKYIVVVGIGGSSLGGKAIHRSLHHSYWNDTTNKERKSIPKVYFLENIDPELTTELLSIINWSHALVVVISKSGHTPETLANFAILRKKLISKHGKDDFAKHIVAITEKSDSPLYILAKKEGYHLFLVSKSIVGRFSVLGPVGLAPSAISGMNVKELLSGALAMDNRCKKQKIFENPAALLATIQYLLYTKKNKIITVLFSYSHHLRWIADWYRQLLAESIGKRLDAQDERTEIGITPVTAIGAIDQHSQLQLFNEGPNDKFHIFLAPEKYKCDLKIHSFGMNLPDLDYLDNKSYAKLFKVEALVTQLTLTNYHRPNLLITIPEINAHGLGQLLFLLEAQIIILGKLLNINVFNQPGVELGKKYAKTFMRGSGNF